MPRPVPSRARRRGILATGALALALTISACSGSAGGLSSTPYPKPEPSPTVTPTPPPPPRWPLTGVLAEDLPDRPAVAVKIENTPSARPQSGLEAADVVWETIVEFEVPRFVAVYHSQVPAEVGPIRSVRPMDVRIVDPLGGLLVYSGGQQAFLDLVAGSRVQAVSHDAGEGGMYRVGRRAAPHNVYGSVQTFLDTADAAHQNPPPEQFTFAEDAAGATAALSGQPAGQVAVNMSAGSYPVWSWDPAAGAWLRSEGSVPASSAAGTRLSATNVVVVEVESYDSGYDAQGGAPVPDLRLEGSGRALVGTGGKVLDGTWTKPARDKPLTLTTASGEPLLLAPGATWVELMPLGRSWAVG